MTTVTDLRNLVRTQTQTQQPELPDQTIDWYLQQAFERTINAETFWPFYAQTWEIVQPAGDVDVPLPGDVNPPGIIALYPRDTTQFRLQQIAPQWAEDHFQRTLLPDGLSPVGYSIWNMTISFWPRTTFTDDRAYVLRGYRRPVTWLTPEGEPDCDSRLHLPLVHYAVALAYEQQEDETLNVTYMDRWQRDVELARRAIMEPLHQRPFAYANSTDSVIVGGPGWVLVPPGP